MHVDDAVEADAEAIASLSGQPTAAVRDMIHDRSVRIAVPDVDADSDRATGEDPRELLGYIAFDAHRDSVHVTGFGGESEAVDRLLREPIRFAETEGMALEAIVGVDDDRSRTSLEDAGFEATGAGPQFDGNPTVRYRRRP